MTNTASTETQPNPRKQGPPAPTWWTIPLLFLSLGYLLLEIIFNAQLVTVAGGKDSSEAALHAIELFGRGISGVGILLLLADALIKGWFVKTPGRAFATLAGLAILIWPSVFFGQKILVDKLLINPSTAEQRQQAYIAQTLRQALTLKVVDIPGIPYDPDHEHSASEMTFLALIGALIYADHTLITVIEAQKEKFVRNYVTKRAQVGFEHHYARYKNFRKTLIKQYKTYWSRSEQYNKAIAEAPAKAG